MLWYAMIFILLNLPLQITLEIEVYYGERAIWDRERGEGDNGVRDICYLPAEIRIKQIVLVMTWDTFCCRILSKKLAFLVETNGETG